MLEFSVIFIKLQEDPMFSSQQPQQMELPLNPPPPRAKSSIFEDDERSRLLQKLLQSKNPEDLQAANRLIKTMVKEVSLNNKNALKHQIFRFSIATLLLGLQKRLD